MKGWRWLLFLTLIAITVGLAACAQAAVAPAGRATSPPTLAFTATLSPDPTSSPSSVPTNTATIAPSATPTPAPTPTIPQPEFDGQRAYQDVHTQVSFGPRLPGSEAHGKFIEWAQAELAANDWAVEIQETTVLGQPVKNIIAKRGVGLTPWIILGAHYDSRFIADRDPDPARQGDPVPGANDGASGAAVLMELSRVLPDHLPKQIWLVFFDAEDQGRIPGWDWILGSRALAESLSSSPDSVVIVDMIGDADLNINKERSSDPDLTADIWQAAAEQGHADVFLPADGYTILDDHTPFLGRGIRAIDIIDFHYPYWHTVNDTVDKVSPQSLFAVGDTLLHWLTRP